MENGPELVLEHFYIEKYMMEEPPLYLVLKDVVIALNAFIGIVISARLVIGGLINLFINKSSRMRHRPVRDTRRTRHHRLMWYLLTYTTRWYQ